MDDDVDVVGDELPGGGAEVDETAALAALEALFGDGDDVEDEADVRRRMRAAARANNPGEDSHGIKCFQKSAVMSPRTCARLMRVTFENKRRDLIR